ncbi:hypothetical protein LUZ61_016194 [Rhynchospora tenuis]|uniref:Subtilisin-like protease n=1 Tax=Rhynchospora tenuis TaxID=198213 RepID=A0AAD6EJN9_9POAL|nr:hypothetical protein LUZ61_016194 [Rhynchospora tenuis]
MNLSKISFLFFLLTNIASYVVAYDSQEKHQIYIITFKVPDNVDISNPEAAETWHKSILSSIVPDDTVSRHIYSYNKVVNGFAAKLTEEEVQAMQKYPGCTSIIPAGKPLQQATTHTPHLLHLNGLKGLWKRTKNMGEGIIIGILDSGITPGHPSFDDKGMAPPPAKWKGHCDFNSTICNKKIIGAKSLLKVGAEEKKHIPPIDEGGHGTHVASTAAGGFVKNIEVAGIAMGKASGVAPRAHLAIYRVCDPSGCAPPDILKGFEEAINDGCDVISISIKGSQMAFHLDPISLGGFYALLNGIFVSVGAANDGPMPGTIANDAPWLLTVAASTTDRQIRSTVKLGNGLQLNGHSLYQSKNWTSKMLPLVYVTGDGPNVNASKCLNGTLDKKMIRGKIVLCDHGIIAAPLKNIIVQEAGGAGTIIATSEKGSYSTQPSFVDDPDFLPTSHVSYVDGMKIKDYILSTKQPVATFLFEGVVHRNPFSPSIASFSSRGPSLLSPRILKPDITGPGVSILAAVPPVLVPPKIIGEDKSKAFYFLSGTSMSTPHLSGIAALVKKEHPDWSPSAIKSAIMTTADVTDIDGKPIVDHKHNPADVFDMGAGQVNPNKALDPGLVYDLKYEDYIPYLCGLGYKDEEVNNILMPAPSVQCAKVKAISEEQLNYPSIGISFQGKNTTEITINRTVTNVGKTKKATYKAAIILPMGMSAEVVPSTMTFTNLNEKKIFKIVFQRPGNSGGSSLGFGELKWISGRYSVRSPIAIIGN